MEGGNVNIFKSNPSQRTRKGGVRTEIDQNRYWMYFVRRATEWLKKEKGYVNLRQMCEQAVILNKKVATYKAPSPNFFLLVMRNEVDALVSEASMLYFFDVLGVDILNTSAEAMKDYMEECMVKYKLLPEQHIPVRPLQLEANKIDWIFQNGSAPYSKKGKKVYGYFASPYKQATIDR
jgi:hypothetical protein